MPTVTDCRDPASRAPHVEFAAARIRHGRIAVVPDEAMYMLVADAFSDYGVNRLQLTKGRADTPLTVLVGAHTTVDGIAAAIPGYARDLMDAFWPGPLTLVLRPQRSLHWPLLGQSLSVRMPLHPLTWALVREVGPTASTSANRIGLDPVQDAEAALEMFDTDVDLYLDAGPVTGASRSTVVDATGPTPQLRRAGAVTTDQIATVAPDLDVTPT